MTFAWGEAKFVLLDCWFCGSPTGESSAAVTERISWRNKWDAVWFDAYLPFFFLSLSTLMLQRHKRRVSFIFPLCCLSRIDFGDPASSRGWCLQCITDITLTLQRYETYCIALHRIVHLNGTSSAVALRRLLNFSYKWTETCGRYARGGTSPLSGDLMLSCHMS